MKGRTNTIRRTINSITLWADNLDRLNEEIIGFIRKNGSKKIIAVYPLCWDGRTKAITVVYKERTRRKR